MPNLPKEFEIQEGLHDYDEMLVDEGALLTELEVFANECHEGLSDSQILSFVGDFATKYHPLHESWARTLARRAYAALWENWSAYNGDDYEEITGKLTSNSFKQLRGMITTLNTVFEWTGVFPDEYQKTDRGCSVFDLKSILENIAFILATKSEDEVNRMTTPDLSPKVWPGDMLAHILGDPFPWEELNAELRQMIESYLEPEWRSSSLVSDSYPYRALHVAGHSPGPITLSEEKRGKLASAIHDSMANTAKNANLERLLIEINAVNEFCSLVGMDAPHPSGFDTSIFLRLHSSQGSVDTSIATLEDALGRRLRFEHLRIADISIAGVRNPNVIHSFLDLFARIPADERDKFCVEYLQTFGEDIWGSNWSDSDSDADDLTKTDAFLSSITSYGPVGLFTGSAIARKLVQSHGFRETNSLLKKNGVSEHDALVMTATGGLFAYMPTDEICDIAPARAVREVFPDIVRLAIQEGDFSVVAHHIANAAKNVGIEDFSFEPFARELRAYYKTLIDMEAFEILKTIAEIAQISLFDSPADITRLFARKIDPGSKLVPFLLSFSANLSLIISREKLSSDYSDTLLSSVDAFKFKSVLSFIKLLGLPPPSNEVVDSAFQEMGLPMHLDYGHALLLEYPECISNLPTTLKNGISRALTDEKSWGGIELGDSRTFSLSNFASLAQVAGVEARFTPETAKAAFSAFLKDSIRQRLAANLFIEQFDLCRKALLPQGADEAGIRKDLVERCNTLTASHPDEYIVSIARSIDSSYIPSDNVTAAFTRKYLAQEQTYTWIGNLIRIGCRERVILETCGAYYCELISRLFFKSPLDAYGAYMKLQQFLASWDKSDETQVSVEILADYLKNQGWYGSIKRLVAFQAPAANAKNDPWTIELAPLLRSVTGKSLADAENLLEFVKEFGLKNLPKLYRVTAACIRAENVENIDPIARSHLHDFGIALTTRGKNARERTPKEIFNDLRVAAKRYRSDLLEDKIPRGIESALGEELFVSIRGKSGWERLDSLGHLVARVASSRPANTKEWFPKAELSVKKIGAAKNGEEHQANLDQIMSAEPYAAIRNNLKNVAGVGVPDKADDMFSLFDDYCANQQAAEQTLLDGDGALKGFQEAFQTKNEEKLVEIMEVLASIDDLPEKYSDLLAYVTGAHLPLVVPPGWDLADVGGQTVSAVHTTSLFIREYIAEHYLHPDQNPQHTGHVPFSQRLRERLTELFGVTQDKKGRLPFELALEKAGISKNVLEATASVSLVPVTGLLRVYSGDIGNACYTSQHAQLAEGLRGVHALIYVKDAGSARETIQGSSLMIEAVQGSTGTPVLVSRAMNPKENFVSSLSSNAVDPESLVEQSLAAVIQAARNLREKRLQTPDCPDHLKRQIVVAPRDNATESSTNRVGVHKALNNLWSSGAPRISLISTPETNFNDYTVWNSYGKYPCYAIWAIDEGGNETWYTKKLL